MVEPVLQLKCYCNNYPWGKKGSQSLAATLCAKTPGTEFKVDESKNYAEMWMGTYPELPSYVLETGQDLQDVLDEHASELIGDTVTQKFGHTKLPYLPKVLSIQKALPLQLHPNKDLASKLHKRDPSNFTDPNHKPEIALALGPFEAFCGFKPLKQIDALLHLEPLRQFLPQQEKTEFDDQTLKQVVNAMLKADEETVTRVVEGLKSRSASEFHGDEYIPSLAGRLEEQYDTADNGIVVALITMNYLRLDAGDSIYIPADGIHAYLSGDIIECMARSNNVLNTGFCPRGDRNSADLFTSCLTFSPHDAKDALLEPKSFDRAKNGKVQTYAPPMSEFDMLLLELKSGEDESVGELHGPAVMIVTKGAGTMTAKGRGYDLGEGYIFFVGKDTRLDFQARSGLQAFIAYVE